MLGVILLHNHCEDCHASLCFLPCRYLVFLQQGLKVVLGRGMPSRIEVLDANQYPDCLGTRGLESVFGYNFTGTTDILLAYSQAAKSQPEIGSVAAFVLNKGQVNPSQNQ